MKKYWTQKEYDILLKLYPDCKTETLALILNRKASLISQKASLLGIQKSEGFRKSPISGRLMKGSEIGAATRFTNQTPGWNKGLKQVDYMSAENIEKTAKTRFKKGQDPHNTVPIGFERITKDGYIEIKVRHLKNGDANNKNFELKHRLLWVENHGPIPSGMVVSIKGTDKINFSIDDLELITMKQNLLQNTMCDTSIVKRFMGIKNPDFVEKIITEMPELIEQKRQTIKLNQKINKEYANDSK